MHEHGDLRQNILEPLVDACLQRSRQEERRRGRTAGLMPTARSVCVYQRHRSPVEAMLGPAPLACPAAARSMGFDLRRPQRIFGT
jgi:hypothetical protein